MQLKKKILLLAVLPLLASLVLIAWAVQLEQKGLADRRRAQVHATFMSSNEVELRNYMALAMSVVDPFYGLGRDDDEIKNEVIKRLASLKFGSDEHFFVYDLRAGNGPQASPDLGGYPLIKIRDAGDDSALRQLLERARQGGGFVTYSGRRPSALVPEPKLGYVAVLKRWGWMLGTGIYLDDIDALVRQLDDEIEQSVDTTMGWIAGAGGIGLTLIITFLLGLRFSENKASDAKLTLMARQILDSQELERAHLSRELHDGTSQTLVAIKLLVESALDRMVGATDAVKSPLVRALERLKEALADVRGMSHRLRPVMLDTLGLSAALQNLGEETCAGSSIEFTLEVEGEPAELPDDVKTVLFRITQEALTNIQKHAACTKVNVQIVFGKSALQLHIVDDGCGFDVERVRTDPRRGIGLRNMRERIETIGGRLDLNSRPGRTSIVAELPNSAIRRFWAANGGLAP